MALYVRVLLVIIFLTVSMFSAVFGQKADSTFSLTGKIMGSEDNYYVHLSHVDDNGVRVEDSCLLVKNTYIFKGSIPYPTRFYLRGKVKSYADDDPNAVSFYLDPGKKHTTTARFGQLKKMSLEGSQSQKEWIEYNKPTKSWKENSIAFINKNRKSYVSPFALRFLKTDIPLDSIQILFQNLDASVQNSHDGRYIKEYLDSRSKSDIGKKIEDFSTVDIKNNPLQLSEFSGKCVLLDFWASWCGPCRKENPELKKVYEKYKNLGFDIIGISSDDSPEKWRAAVKKDGLPWHHVLSGYDAKDFSKADVIGSKYGITALPTFIIIDEEGLVLDRFVGAGSVEKLDSLLKNKYKTE